MTEESIYYMRRRRIVDDVSYDEEFFIPLFLLPDMGEEDMSAKALYELIEEKGTKKIFKVQQTIETRTRRQQWLRRFLRCGKALLPY